MAYYGGRDHYSAKKAPSQPIGQDKRNMIHSMHVVDNPCTNFYDPRKKPGIIQQVKSIKSGPERFIARVRRQLILQVTRFDLSALFISETLL